MAGERVTTGLLIPMTTSNTVQLIRKASNAIEIGRHVGPDGAHQGVIRLIYSGGVDVVCQI
jgi:hypothetical protein